MQRQLDDLSRHFDIERDDRSKPYGYQWKMHSAGLSLPGLTEKEAVVLALAEQHLQSLLPSQVMASMEPFFRQAQARLTAHPHHASQERAASAWMHKVRVVSTTQPLLAPEMQADVVDAVSAALWRDEWLDLVYRNSAGKTVRGRVMPLGLAQQGERLYLVCRFEGHGDDRILAVHRIGSATASGLPFERPANFDLATYDSEGRFSFGDGSLVDVDFVITRTAGLHLLESRLCADQQVEEVAEGYRIRARVPATERLKWWLRGFGPDVTVIGPRELALAVHGRRAEEPA